MDSNNHFHDYFDNLASKNCPALGIFPTNASSVQLFPFFDCVVLLSVHHQWVKSNGDDVARELVKALHDKANRIFFIEFAGIADKYGYEHGRYFENNSEDSVVSFAYEWLERAGITNIKYMGKTREFPPKEPHRFLFACSKVSEPIK